MPLGYIFLMSTVLERSVPFAPARQGGFLAKLRLLGPKRWTSGGMGLLAVLGVVLIETSGCSSAAVVRVELAAAPAASAAGLAALADSDVRLPVIPSEIGRLTDPDARKFVFLREAFWNHQPHEAVSVLRQMRQQELVSADDFYKLALQCYEESSLWEAMLAFMAEFDLQEAHSERLRFAQFMAALPARKIEFSAPANPVPFKLRMGDMVVVEVNINGVKAQLLVDTGWRVTWLSSKFARRAGVQRLTDSSTVSTPPVGLRSVPQALVLELQLGGTIVRNMPVSIGSVSLVEFGLRVDGVLGWDLLQYMDVTWDFPAKVMTLAPPRETAPIAVALSGRAAPILTVISPAGRPLDLLLDTGMHAGRAAVSLYANDGVLASKTPLDEFRPTFWANVGWGTDSFWVRRPKVAKPFDFWIAGYRFRVATASLLNESLKRENFSYVDGIVGNAPFLSGKLRLCGVRREASFEASSVILP
jgi:predicted aspartyl protease